MEEKDGKKKSSLGCFWVILALIVAIVAQCMGPVFKANMRYKMEHAPTSVIEIDYDNK